MSNRVSLLVPTMNRPGFIERMLRYYSDRGFKGQIWIGDSSTGQHLDRGRAVVAKYAEVLDIRYREFPGVMNHVCVKWMAEASDTPYGAYLADDDFLTHEGLLESLAFLEGRQEYSAVHGLGTILLVPTSNPSDMPTDANFYAQSTWPEERASERIENYMRTGTQPLFALHRMSVVRRMYEHVHEVSEFNIAGELLPAGTSAISGKIGEIDCLTLVRTTHPEVSAIRYRPMVERLLSAEWQSSVLKTAELLEEALVRQDGISAQEAGKVVKGALHEYLARQIVRSKAPAISRRVRLRKRIGTLLGVRSIRDFAQAIKGGTRHRMTLPALTRPQSRDYAYFAPVLASFGPQVK